MTNDIKTSTPTVDSALAPERADHMAARNAQSNTDGPKREPAYTDLEESTAHFLYFGASENKRRHAVEERLLNAAKDRSYLLTALTKLRNKLLEAGRDSTLRNDEVSEDLAQIHSAVRVMLESSNQLQVHALKVQGHCFGAVLARLASAGVPEAVRNEVKWLCNVIGAPVVAPDSVDASLIDEVTAAFPFRTELEQLKELAVPPGVDDDSAESAPVTAVVDNSTPICAPSDFAAAVAHAVSKKVEAARAKTENADSSQLNYAVERSGKVTDSREQILAQLATVMHRFQHCSLAGRVLKQVYTPEEVPGQGKLTWRSLSADVPLRCLIGNNKVQRLINLADQLAWRIIREADTYLLEVLEVAPNRGDGLLPKEFTKFSDVARRSTHVIMHPAAAPIVKLDQYNGPALAAAGTLGTRYGAQVLCAYPGSVRFSRIQDIRSAHSFMRPEDIYGLRATAGGTGHYVTSDWSLQIVPCVPVDEAAPEVDLNDAASLRGSVVRVAMEIAYQVEADVFHVQSKTLAALNSQKEPAR